MLKSFSLRENVICRLLFIEEDEMNCAHTNGWTYMNVDWINHENILFLTCWARRIFISIIVCSFFCLHLGSLWNLICYTTINMTHWTWQIHDDLQHPQTEYNTWLQTESWSKWQICILCSKPFRNLIFHNIAFGNCPWNQLQYSSPC